MASGFHPGLTRQIRIVTITSKPVDSEIGLKKVVIDQKIFFKSIGALIKMLTFELVNNGNGQPPSMVSSTSTKHQGFSKKGLTNT